MDKPTDRQMDNQTQLNYPTTVTYSSSNNSSIALHMMFLRQQNDLWVKSTCYKKRAGATHTTASQTTKQQGDVEREIEGSNGMAMILLDH